MIDPARGVVVGAPGLTGIAAIARSAIGSFVLYALPVLGILIVAHEESRQVVSRVQMRQDLPLELGKARGLGEAEHVSLLSIIKHKTAKV